jgi:hypothetical protein
LNQCVSGWAIVNNQVATIPDVYADPRVPIAAYRPTFVRSMAMVPVGNPPFGAIGAYWGREHTASDQEITTLRTIADSALLQVQ